ncbi:MAG: hypothetical protein WDN00_15230 [Limisphaerales bacterium]
MANNVYDTNLVGIIINDMIAFAKLTNGNLQPTIPVHLGDHYLHAANGQVIFDITGPTNVRIAVERSTNLPSVWQAIATNRLSAGSVWFTNAILDASPVLSRPDYFALMSVGDIQLSATAISMMDNLQLSAHHN